MKIKVIEGKTGYGKTSYIKSELLQLKGKTICLSSYEEYAALCKRLAGNHFDRSDISINEVFDFMNSEREYLFINFDLEDEIENRFDFLIKIIEIIINNINDKSINLIIDNIESFITKSEEAQLLSLLLFQNKDKLNKLIITYTTFDDKNALHLLQDHYHLRNLSVREYIIGNMDITAIYSHQLKDFLNS